MSRMLLFLMLSISILTASYSQTTDLSIIVEAQDLDGNDVSQVNIYEDFQYLITILNTGNAVNDAAFSIQLDDALLVYSFSSQNNSGGASDAANFNLSATNLLIGSVANLPNNSSVEILVLVRAPTFIGGIAANANISPPDGTEDTNTSNNQSIISIDVLDLPIEFTVTHEQITPIPDTPINAWGDTVTYQFTITNNSPIAFALDQITASLQLTSPIQYGRPIVELVSIACIGSTNGTDCPDLSGIQLNLPITINSVAEIFGFGTNHQYTVDGSLTFEMVYRYLDPLCGFEMQPLEVESSIEVTAEANQGVFSSNAVTTNLIEAELCDITDVCIETIQTDPEPGSPLTYGEEVTFETTVCNNGPLGAELFFFLLNSGAAPWSFISIECLSTTGPIDCDDFFITQDDLFWVSNEFVLPADTTITIRTVVVFNEPECSNSGDEIMLQVRSTVNIVQPQLFDSDLNNNFDTEPITLPAVPECPSSDLSVTKTQISPQLPQGSTTTNTAEWGMVGYEIVVTNTGDLDGVLELVDFMTTGANDYATASLVSVECTSSTGSASCFPIQHANIGVLLDGEPEDNVPDIFWEILPEDNWIIPANSSITFEVFVDWFPECFENAIIGSNSVEVNYANDVIDESLSNNSDFVETIFAPCIDLIVQTFPEFTQVDVNQTFDWIIDISNSTTSSAAVDVFFEDTINPVFTITGTPSCEVTSGNATCITTFDITANGVTGTIPAMDAGSTVRIRIPVTAPAFGGAFNNIAEALPSPENNEELTPETNISISNVQVIAPTLEKVFDPDTIMEGNESTLSFTIFNVSGNPTQSNIAFTDNLPPNIILSGSPVWVESNGCTATFIGNPGDVFVGVTDLIFPDGVASCTFSVAVTSDVPGQYLNNASNFTDNNNIDTSQASATLTVTEDTSNVDIEILKTVSPDEASLGNAVTFTITATNIGTTTASGIEVSDLLPSGYEYNTFTASSGSFDTSSFVWSIPELSAGESASLTLQVTIISSVDLTNLALLSHVDQVDRDDTNNRDDATVTINNCLKIPRGISPNEDGKNDYLVIPCIEEYPHNVIKIYNRHGVQIYESKGYSNTWDGKPNMGFPNRSKVLPVGTYYYILEIEGNPNAVVGWIYLNY